MKYMNNHYGVSRIYGKKGMNLQLFAEEDPEEDPEDDDPEEDPEDDPEEKKGGKKKRLYTKKELGAIVAREVAKALKEKEDELSEAEKLANMTEEQKKAHKQKQKDDEVAELKKKVARMELSKEASKLLKNADITPMDEILDFVVGDDAESTSKNIEKFVAIKDAIVLASEKARNTGKTPKVVTGSGSKKVTKEDIAKMGYKEILAMKQKDPEWYKKLMEE